MTDDRTTLQRYQRRTIDLHEAHWAVLDALAEELHACPAGGSSRGQPSWRAIVRLIAEGHYILTPSTAARMEATQLSDNGTWRLRWRKRPSDKADFGKQ